MAARNKKNKRKKSPRKKKKITLNKLNSAQLRHTGSQLFEIGKYADAITYFKELHTREPGEESSNLLTQSYQKRIEELQNKEMATEALAVANSMHQQCGSSPHPRILITLLCQCRKYDKAVAVYQENMEAITRKEHDELEELFSVVVLAGNNQLLDVLPPDGSIHSHFPQAKAVLSAFCQQDTDLAERELKAISFRSPYRNFRLLISGLLHLQTDPAQANTIFEKIPATSPYVDLIDIFSLQGMKVKAKVEQLVAARNTENFSQLLAVSGLNHDQGRLLTKLFDVRPTAYKKILRLLINYSQFFPKEIFLQMGRKLILHCTKTDHTYIKIVQNISKSELIRMEALMSELDDANSEAIMAWNDYLQALPSNTPDYTLRKALVMRKQAELSKWAPFHEYHNPDKGLHRLLESVELDPDDRQAWLEIIKLSRKTKSATEAYRTVNRAVEQFPDDIEFLLQAIEATSQRGAFKKASKYADRLLEIDPINVRGKELLAKAHIAHGHKLCRQKKYHLAEKEFTTAKGESRNRSLGGRSLICLGMLAFLQKERKKGEELLKKGSTSASSPLMGAILTALEARIFQLPKIQINAFDKSLRETCKDAVLILDECYKLAEWEQNSHLEERRHLTDCFRMMKTYFSRVADLSWSPQKAKVLSEALFATALYPQLKKVVTVQLKTDPANLYFRFMNIIAITRDGTKPMPWEMKEELWEIQDDAWYSGDQTLASRANVLYRKCRIKDPVMDNSTDEVFKDTEIFKILSKAIENTISNLEPENKPPANPGKQQNLFDFLPGEDE